MHQSAHAVLARSLDEEIGCRLARSSGLRPDARVARQQRAVGKRWPVAPDRGIEALGATRVYVVADALDPFDVGAEAGLAGQVERHVHAEAAGLGHRVDQAGKRRAARERVVIALRIELARRELARVAFDAFRHARGLQTRAVDEQPGPYLFISRSQDDSVGSNFGLVQGTLQREHRAVRDAVLVEQPLSLHAARRLEAAFRVIDSRVNDFRIARAGVRADRILGFQDDDFAARRGEGARHREADHARADDDGLYAFQARMRL